MPPGMVPRSTIQLCEWRKPSADCQGKDPILLHLVLQHLQRAPCSSLQQQRRPQSPAQERLCSKCWDQGNPPCRTGICSICEEGAGSCCRSNFRDWSPECVGQGARGLHRCGDTNVECLELCGEKDSNGTYIPGLNKKACIKETDTCIPPPPPPSPPSPPLQSSPYTLVKHTASWHDAKDGCLQRGMQLASVLSATENELLVIAAEGHIVWIGGTDEDSEGTWKWSSEIGRASCRERV